MKELREVKLQFKRPSQRNFLEVGMGGMREEEEQTWRVSVKCACVIAVTSSLRVLHLFPVCSKGRWWCWSMGRAAEALVFSIIPEAIVRAASERLTVASWDFTKTQPNIRRKGWNVKIRAGGVKSGEGGKALVKRTGTTNADVWYYIPSDIIMLWIYSKRWRGEGRVLLQDERTIRVVQEQYVLALGVP